MTLPYFYTRIIYAAALDAYHLRRKKIMSKENYAKESYVERKLRRICQMPKKTMIPC